MSRKKASKMKRPTLDKANVETLTQYLFSTGYKSANSLEELNERVKGRFPSLMLTNSWSTKQNNFSQQLWDLFEKAPEFFLFTDFTYKLEEQYEGFYHKPGNRLDNFSRAVSAMRNAVLKIYKAYLPNYRADYKITNFREELDKMTQEQREAKFVKEDLQRISLTAAKPKVEKPKKFYKFSKDLRELLANDQTELDKFAPKGDATVVYLLKKGVTNLAEFMVWIADEKNRNNIQSCAHYNGHKAFQNFCQSIFDYANKIANREEVSAEPVKEEMQEEIDLGLDKVSDKDFFETLRNLACGYFKKDSETMRQINQRMTQYVSNKVKPFIEDGFSKDDIKEEMDNEYTPYKKMVDAKRNQIELEAKKREVADYVAKRLHEEEDYKVKPSMFNKELGVHKDKHAGSFNREL